MRIAALLSAFALASLPLAAHADVVTFDSLGGNNADSFTSYAEDGFTVTRTSGDAFVGKGYGNPAPSVFAGPHFGSASTTLEITAGGQLFSFESWSFGANGGAADYVITGFLDGVSIFDLAGSRASGGFGTLLSGTSLSFDKLTFELTAHGTSMNFDNFAGAISAVPEPATWAMMLAGFGLAGAALRRRCETAFA